MAGSRQSIVSTTATYWVITFRRLWNGNDGQSRKVHEQELHFCGAQLQLQLSPTHT